MGVVPNEELIRFHDNERIVTEFRGKLGKVVDIDPDNFKRVFVPFYCLPRNWSYISVQHHDYDIVEPTGEVLAEWALDMLKQ